MFVEICILVVYCVYNVTDNLPGQSQHIASVDKKFTTNPTRGAQLKEKRLNLQMLMVHLSSFIGESASTGKKMTNSLICGRCGNKWMRDHRVIVCNDLITVSHAEYVLAACKECQQQHQRCREL